MPLLRSAVSNPVNAKDPAAVYLALQIDCFLRLQALSSGWLLLKSGVAKGEDRNRRIRPFE